MRFLVLESEWETRRGCDLPWMLTGWLSRCTSASRVPFDWAGTQNNLGNALKSLGVRERNVERIEQGVNAYRAALEIFTRERAPRNWASTQHNLGSALASQGELAEDRECLEAAVRAHEAALSVRTREESPLDWGRTQFSLGNALKALGELEESADLLNQAVTAYLAALEQCLLEEHDSYRRLIERNLGLAMLKLRER